MNNYIYQNLNLINFCNKIQSYANILNDDESQKMFFDSLSIFDDEEECNESLDICNFILQNINLLNIDNIEEINNKINNIINTIILSKRLIRL